MTEIDLKTALEELFARVSRLEQNEVERAQSIQTLRESEEKYRILLDESSDPVFTFTRDGQYRYVNKAFADGVGKKQADIIGKKIWDVFSKDEADKRFAAVKWVFEHGETKVIEVRVPRQDTDHYYITTVKPIFNELNEVSTVICISKEITERKHMEQELQYLSTHDTLTGLYNRNFFETEIQRIQNSRLYPVSMVIADMDNLKMVNDRFGHTAGDELICQVARLFQATFRAEDIVARIGGDEFALLLPRTAEAAVQAAVSRLREQLAAQPGTRINLSIGMATGEDGSLLVDLMRLADDRMYQEKFLHKHSRDSKPA